MTPNGWVLSKAHDWVALLPMSMHMIKCLRCGAKTRIGEWDIPRCIAHYESEKSGYLEEETA